MIIAEIGQDRRSGRSARIRMQPSTQSPWNGQDQPSRRPADARNGPKLAMGKSPVIGVDGRPTPTPVPTVT
jgi:hypothetical protein